ncbi:hypothetical protein C5E02_07330 [Rathayibacter rathayi]|uniref:Uncharacterized protein n=1 Tax=Rathayibacter rathayi TaxID=33887 RepID=A0ABD6WBY7_RATRA|nr:hypothetical protein [Rathayibacter rathayi]AZZ49082.1 hypothetical protein C1O28_07615 [Rathayibacter rathayi]MWV75987.1 hypothetical protein [Rathayibacter rathayi NCPPB 2980 = VKM Ac-1601]PPF16231.1 hypothetical protein C5C04_00100 [Rathayibacter rathayi]PPF51805.1 hypothetical protein C5C08_00105 [Rathayibacter rathayi]PPF83410.1 hypothetical protein C5C14_00105 [Rathayibacter rathayi]
MTDTPTPARGTTLPAGEPSTKTAVRPSRRFRIPVLIVAAALIVGGGVFATVPTVNATASEAGLTSLENQAERSEKEATAAESTAKNMATAAIAAVEERDDALFIASLAHTSRSFVRFGPSDDGGQEVYEQAVADANATYQRAQDAAADSKVKASEARATAELDAEELEDAQAEVATAKEGAASSMVVGIVLAVIGLLGAVMYLVLTQL